MTAAVLTTACFGEVDIAVRYYCLFRASLGVVSEVPPDLPPPQGKDGIKWIQVGSGQLAARPQPGNVKTLKAWKATVLVTLLSEPSQRLALAVEECELEWVQAEVKPIANVNTRLTEQDVASFRQIDAVLRRLREGDGERVVVHCAAGMHRTGCFIYVLLRRDGLSSEEALEAIRQTREVTWDEMMKSTRKRPDGLWHKAEEIFQMLYLNKGALDSWEDAGEAESAAKNVPKADGPKQDYSNVQAALRKVLGEGETLSLNQLNQEAACKTNLKPALKKKANVKTLNKKALEDVVKGCQDFSVSDKDNMVYLTKK